MLLIYGANGYTGRLIVEECVRRGLRPIVAGRNAAALQEIAARHDLKMRVASLPAASAGGRPQVTPPGALPPTPHGELLAMLEGVTVVLHCAGPFFRTSALMVQACLDVGAHYLDITGEIAVFEACRHRHAAAQQRKVVILPGVGFDVVPTDCLAAKLAARLPGAALLELAFAGGGGFSRGTLKTMLLGGSGGAIRQDGRIVPVPRAWRTREIPFRDKPRQAVTIPWGDVSTAEWSTKIPNIHTYLALPSSARWGMAAMPLLQLLLAFPATRRFVERQIDAHVRGPNRAVRERARMQVWGRVTHPDGRTVEDTLVTAEGYRFTAIAAVESARRMMTNPPEAGYHTPSTAFGADFVDEVAALSL
ncbi:saccharopine dehydrogenase family protein [Gemmatimonas sp.]|jgi:saccharopine dehydrogenase (NAD+, L-lysine-forming)|uniref:saccharopine dehydrogenase family protein n=1 Tax=Gemmatimonas sp. TaxID=1962908 RepID=UPI0037C17105